MATTYEIIQGISQAIANAYDGALDDKGEPLKIGLKREEGDMILDARVMDGFNAQFHGDKLIIKYQSEVKLKDTHDSKFENEIESMINKISKYLKKEYKKVTGNALTLTKDGEVDVLVQRLSNYRTWVEASATYKIGGLGDTESAGETGEHKLDDAIKKFLAIGKDKYPGAKKPSNITRKGD
tara:strand:+ start:1120 stop:1665 length:546 start_codon:yes stop_codon:yes gene_type:complete